MTTDEFGDWTAVPTRGLSIPAPPRVVIPVAVLDGQTVPGPLVDLLAPAEIVVLGYQVLPEQTPTEQASMQFEDRARDAVDEIAQTFATAGQAVDTRIVFTHDREKTIDRVAAEVEATAVLLPNPVGEISDVLVPVRGAVDVDRLSDLVATLIADSEIQVTLWALTGGPLTTQTRELLDAAVLAFRDWGLTDEQVQIEFSDIEHPTRAIRNRSDEFDLIVMGEGEQSLSTTVFGEPTERIAAGGVAPVLVVRESIDASL